MRVLILGGSTAGASVASQLRRQSEAFEITLIENSGHLATAYCGLAYAAGGLVRSDPDYLRPLDPDSLRQRFNVTVRLHTEVRAIDRGSKRVAVRDSEGHEEWLPYDKLVYALGARSARPAIPGVDLPGVHALRDTDDLARLLTALQRPGVARAVIVGAGFIGLELAESLRHRGLEVTLVELGEQVMNGKMDPDMARPTEQHVRENGVALLLGEAVQQFVQDGSGKLAVHTTRRVLDADVVILAAGIRPNTELAKEAGLELGETGALRVDAGLQTSAADIYALGDAIECACRVSGQPIHVPLAGPLSRQAKVLAARMAGKLASYPGSQGTFVCKVFEQTIASTGMTEAQLKRGEIPYDAVLLSATNHVYFYPGVAQMTLKLLYAPDNGRILGAQGVGGEGVDKRIDVLATAIAGGMCVADLEFLELAYAPPYGAPKDPVNQAAAVAVSQMENRHTLVHPNTLGTPEFARAVLVDIRTADEFEASGLPGALHIPAERLREEAGSLPRDRPVVLYCNSGAKAVTGQRILAAAGCRAYNLMGGLAYMRGQALAPTHGEAGARAAATPASPACDVELDLRGMVCPGPLVAARRHLVTAPVGHTARILTTDAGFQQDFGTLIDRLQLEVLEQGRAEGAYFIKVRTSQPPRDKGERG